MSSHKVTVLLNQRLTESWALDAVTVDSEMVQGLLDEWESLVAPVKINVLCSLLGVRQREQLGSSLQPLLDRAASDQDDWVKTTAQILSPLLQQPPLPVAVASLPHDFAATVDQIRDLLSKQGAPEWRPYFQAYLERVAAAERPNPFFHVPEQLRLRPLAPSSDPESLIPSSQAPLPSSSSVNSGSHASMKPAVSLKRNTNSSLRSKSTLLERKPYQQKKSVKPLSMEQSIQLHRQEEAAVETVVTGKRVFQAQQSIFEQEQQQQQIQQQQQEQLEQPQQLLDQRPPDDDLSTMSSLYTDKADVASMASQLSDLSEPLTRTTMNVPAPPSIAKQISAGGEPPLKAARIDLADLTSLDTSLSSLSSATLSSFSTPTAASMVPPGSGQGDVDATEAANSLAALTSLMSDNAGFSSSAAAPPYVPNFDPRTDLYRANQLSEADRFLVQTVMTQGFAGVSNPNPAAITSTILLHDEAGLQHFAVIDFYNETVEFKSIAKQ